MFFFSYLMGRAWWRSQLLRRKVSRQKIQFIISFLFSWASGQGQSRLTGISNMSTDTLSLSIMYDKLQEVINQNNYQVTRFLSTISFFSSTFHCVIEGYIVKCHHEHRFFVEEILFVNQPSLSGKGVGSKNAGM